MKSDSELLGQYAEAKCEDAFAELVRRHANLVYSAALRQVRAPHLREEITQATFIILAGKASSLSSKIILPGWLCRTARYARANALTIQRTRPPLQPLLPSGWAINVKIFILTYSITAVISTRLHA
jgi:DNA-directed RNA polymerase specialized sigma24 family protein